VDSVSDRSWPAASRSTFFAAGAAVAVAFSLFGLFTSLAPGFLAGAGAGAVFKGGISTVLDIAPDEAKGEALAGLFLAAYLGLAVPVIALGFATQAFSARTALLGFSALLVVVIALVARKLLARRAA
jgi:MFS family permease